MQKTYTYARGRHDITRTTKAAANRTNTFFCTLYVNGLIKYLDGLVCIRVCSLCEYPVAYLKGKTVSISQCTEEDKRNH